MSAVAEMITLRKGDHLYPRPIAEFVAGCPTLTGLGNISILDESSKIGFVSSVRCPGNLILQTYDVARTFRDEGRTVIGGFHSPMEKECLFILLKGRQPIVVFLARDLTRFRVPSEWRRALLDGRLLILSAFPGAPRPTVDLAVRRNLLVAALSDEIFITHAQPGSKTEAFARTVAAWGKSLSTFDDARYNETLLALGAKPLQLGVGGK